jgi:hypothetical protein
VGVDKQEIIVEALPVEEIQLVLFLAEVLAQDTQEYLFQV